MDSKDEKAETVKDEQAVDDAYDEDDDELDSDDPMMSELLNNQALIEHLLDDIMRLEVENDELRTLAFDLHVALYESLTGKEVDQDEIVDMNNRLINYEIVGVPPAALRELDE